MFRSPIFYAFLALVISKIIIALLLPEVSCMDGWKSNSIGNSGACSHHGGINRFPEIIGDLLCFAVAFFVWKKAKQNQNKLNNPENKIHNHQ